MDMCKMCGKEAVVVSEDAIHLCVEHARDYSVYRCEACDVLCTTRGAMPLDRSCTTCRIERGLASLSDEELVSVDVALSRRKIIPAIRLSAPLASSPANTPQALDAKPPPHPLRSEMGHDRFAQGDEQEHLHGEPARPGRPARVDRERDAE